MHIPVKGAQVQMGDGCASELLRASGSTIPIHLSVLLARCDRGGVSLCHFIGIVHLRHFKIYFYWKNLFHRGTAVGFYQKVCISDM